MLDIFNIASTAPQDKSIGYLAQIFGVMSGVLTSPGGTTAESVTLLSALFRVFNTAMLVIGVFVVVYVMVIGAMKTAHEGEAMGKQWNSLWIPIRIVLGIAGLFPTASGYCALQIIIMWVIVQGIGAADSLWNTALVYISEVVSPYGQISVPTVGVQQKIRFLFDAVSCDATLRMSSPIDRAPEEGGYFCDKKSGNPFCSSGFPNDGTSTQVASSTPYLFGPNGACGKMTSTCDIATACAGTNASSLNCKICTAQQAALLAIIKQQQLIANSLAQSDFSYRNFYYNSAGGSNPQYVNDYCSARGKSKDQCCLAEVGTCERYGSGFFPAPDASIGNVYDPQNANPAVISNILWPYSIKAQVDVDGTTDFIGAETSFYNTKLVEVVSAFMAERAQNINMLDQDMRNAASTGWIFAGAFYYTFGRSNAANQVAIPTFDVSQGELTSSDYSKIRINNKAAEELAALAQAQSQNAQNTTQSGTANNAAYSKPVTSTNPILKPLTESLSSMMADISQTFYDASKTGSNPMFAIQQLGMTLLMIVEIFFAVFLIITIVLGIAGNFSAFVLGTGIINPIGPAMTLVYFVLIPALYGLMGILAAYGGLLGIYVPLIPFTMFTGGVITWFLLVIEAMVAAPLVAIGIMMPSGHHDIMGKSEPAIMLVLNIFLRPSLMILGLLVGMLLSAVLLQMILYTFWQIVLPGTTSALSAASSVVLSWIFYLGAFVALVVTVVNKSYATIYLLPDRVITWIGGHAAQLGVETEMDREGKGAVEGAGRGIGGAASKVGETPKQQRDAASAAENDYQKKNAKKASGATGSGGDISAGGDDKTP